MADDKKEKIEPEDNGRSMKEVSKDMKNAGFSESPEPEKPKAPEPKKLTPEEMKKHPDEFDPEKEDDDQDSQEEE